MLTLPGAATSRRDLRSITGVLAASTRQSMRGIVVKQIEMDVAGCFHSRGTSLPATLSWCPPCPTRKTVCAERDFERLPGLPLCSLTFRWGVRSDSTKTELDFPQ